MDGAKHFSLQLERGGPAFRRHLHMVSEDDRSGSRQIPKGACHVGISAADLQTKCDRREIRRIGSCRFDSHEYGLDLNRCQIAQTRSEGFRGDCRIRSAKRSRGQGVPRGRFAFGSVQHLQVPLRIRPSWVEFGGFSQAGKGAEGQDGRDQRNADSDAVGEWASARVQQCHYRPPPTEFATGFRRPDVAWVTMKDQTPFFAAPVRRRTGLSAPANAAGRFASALN